MTHEEIELDLKKQHIAGNAYAVITICSLILMGFGIYQFVGYLSTQESMLNRMDDRNQGVATMRITQCHKIQEDSVQVMKEVSQAINEHHRAIDSLNHTVGELKDSVEKNTHKIEQLILK